MSEKVPTKSIVADSSDSGADKSPEKKVPKISGKLFSKSRRKKSTVDPAPTNFSKPVDQLDSPQQNLFKVKNILFCSTSLPLASTRWV